MTTLRQVSVKDEFKTAHFMFSVTFAGLNMITLLTLK
jgi:hypothetical protein